MSTCLYSIYCSLYIYIFYAIGIIYHTWTEAINAGLLNVTSTVLTATVIPSITLCIKEYFAGPVYDDTPCGEDVLRRSSHVSTSI